jgi:glycosyltransferase involved in cell wall biosynthesis
MAWVIPERLVRVQLKRHNERNWCFPGVHLSASVGPLNPGQQVVVVVPCFNEARSIARLVETVLSLIPVVIVVNDASTDDTRLLAQKSGASVLNHAANLGKGAALATGLRQAQEDGAEFVITMDGDGQHDPVDLPGFLAAIEADDADLVVGNRMTDSQTMPWLRKRVNLWMSRRLSRRARKELPDTQCGYRLIRLAAWWELDLHTTGFEVESEMLMAFLAAGKRVRFVPVRTIYKEEHSKIHPLRDTIRWLRWWWGGK